MGGGCKKVYSTLTNKLFIILQNKSWWLTVCFALIAVSINAKQIIVSTDKPPLLKDAVEKTAAGDTIIIESGEYAVDKLTLDKPICIIGKGFPIMDGNMERELFYVCSNDVSIQGITFQKTGKGSLIDYAGIKANKCTNLKIINCRFLNTFFGMHLSEVNDALIEGNYLESYAENQTNSGNGIHLWKCIRAKIINNRVKGHRDGIYFEFVINSSVHKNISEHNLRYGLHFMFSHNDSYMDNTFQHNGAGVAVMYTHGVEMQGNHFVQNRGSSAYGLLLKEITDSKIVNNTFEDNTIGIHSEGSNRILIKHNDFVKNGWAIRLMASCMDDSITQNNFIANTFDMSTNGENMLNFIYGNYWDKYHGYDLNKDKVGDVPYHPINVYSYVIEQAPYAILLYRSFIVQLMDLAEKSVPSLTPVNLRDNFPRLVKVRHVKN